MLLTFPTIDFARYLMANLFDSQNIAPSRYLDWITLDLPYLPNTNLDFK